MGSAGAGFGNPLIVSDGESWFFRRRLMQPVFVHRHVAEFARLMVAHAAGTLDAWKTHANRDVPLDMAPAIGNLIREAKTHQIPSAIQTGKQQGMIQMDQSIAALLAGGVIDAEEAYAKAMDKSLFRPPS